MFNFFLQKCFFLSAMFFCLCLVSPGVSKADTYKIDASHSTIEFRVRHLGISSVRGSFAKVEGEINYDKNKLENSSANATISVSSINTLNKKRDDHLRSPDFLDQVKFPEITFKSKKLNGSSKDNFTLVGDLTILGTTKEVALDVELGGAATDPWGNERVAFSGSTEINRRDFGITWSKTLDSGSLVVGEKVKILIEVEGIKKK